MTTCCCTWSMPRPNSSRRMHYCKIAVTIFVASVWLQHVWETEIYLESIIFAVQEKMGEGTDKNRVGESIPEKWLWYFFQVGNQGLSGIQASSKILLTGINGKETVTGHTPPPAAVPPKWDLVISEEIDILISISQSFQTIVPHKCVQWFFSWKRHH